MESEKISVRKEIFDLLISNYRLALILLRSFLKGGIDEEQRSIVEAYVSDADWLARTATREHVQGVADSEKTVFNDENFRSAATARLLETITEIAWKQGLIGSASAMMHTVVDAEQCRYVLFQRIDPEDLGRSYQIAIAVSEQSNEELVAHSTISSGWTAGSIREIAESVIYAIYGEFTAPLR